MKTQTFCCYLAAALMLGSTMLQAQYRLASIDQTPQSRLLVGGRYGVSIYEIRKTDARPSVSLTAPRLLKSDRADSTSFGEFNGDGFTDVAILTDSNDAIQWAPGSQSEEMGFGFGDYNRIHGGRVGLGRFIDTGDLDGDGDIDLLYHTSFLGLEWAENPGSFPAPEEWNRHPIPHTSTDDNSDVMLVDIDGDGHPHFLLHDRLFRRSVLRLLRNNGNGEFDQEHILDDSENLRIADLAPSDVNGDTLTDLLIIDHDGQLFWRENIGEPGGEWPIHSIGEDPTRANALAPIDMDGDGDIDFIVHSRDDATEGMAWYENQGMVDHPWPRHWISETIDAHLEILTGDLNGDGQSDLLYLIGEEGPHLQPVLGPFNLEHAAIPETIPPSMDLFIEDGEVHLSFGPSDPFRTDKIEISTDLVEWEPLATSERERVEQFQTVGQPTRFYRLIRSLR
ncbi:MAG: VCBS repeat-containing protein [Verrucomicrobiota bacterium]